MTWQPIDTAPKDRPFLAKQNGEIYVAKYTDEDKPRICFRTHSLYVQSHHRVINVEMDGKTVRAHVPVEEPWQEIFEHHWTFWTRGFGFAPTEWADIP